MRTIRTSVLVLSAAAVLAAQPPAPGGQGRPAGAPAGGAARPAARPNFLISRAQPDPAAVERGQKLFVASCGFCHGSRANGGESGPDLVRSVLALRDEGGDQIGPVILKGRPEKGMQGFPMSETQIKDIAAFLRFRQQAAIDRSSYEIKDIVTGNAAKGQAFFSANCASCHSTTGDLKGVGSKYDPVALQARFLYPEIRRFGRRGGGPAGKPTVVTVTLPSGRSFSGNLDYIDDFNVALRDSSNTYLSFARADNVKVDIRDPLAGHRDLLAKYTDDDMHNMTAFLVTLK